MTEPTDAEIKDLYAEQTGFILDDSPAALLDFACAVLAKWGTPALAAPWRSAVLDLIDECPGLTMEQDRWLSRRVKELDFESTPQPTQAQAVAPESAEFDQFLSDVLTAAGLVTYGKQCRALGERLADMCVKLRIHGIKGGQHVE